jgi:hypothetical protein
MRWADLDMNTVKNNSMEHCLLHSMCFPFAAILQCCHAAMLQCYNATMLQCYNATMLQCCNATMLPCYNVTMLQCYNAIIIQGYDAAMLHGRWCSPMTIDHSSLTIDHAIIPIHIRDEMLLDREVGENRRYMLNSHIIWIPLFGVSKLKHHRAMLISEGEIIKVRDWIISWMKFYKWYP